MGIKTVFIKVEIPKPILNNEKILDLVIDLFNTIGRDKFIIHFSSLMRKWTKIIESESFGSRKREEISRFRRIVGLSLNNQKNIEKFNKISLFMIPHLIRCHE